MRDQPGGFSPSSELAPSEAVLLFVHKHSLLEGIQKTVTDEIPAEYFPIFTLLPSPACQLYVLYKQIKGVLLSCRILLAGGL